MTETNTLTAIGFSPITAEDKPLIESYLAEGGARGGEYSFANLYLWGRQSFAVLHGCLLLFSRFGKRVIYPFPVGAGDKKAAVDALLAHAREQGMHFRFMGILPHEKEALEAMYPGKFRFIRDEGTFDYVYDIDDLADLPGKKYHGKRNHLNRFEESFPDCTAEVLCEANLPLAALFADAWYAERAADDPDTDFTLERAALEKALRERDALSLEGMILVSGGDVLALTLASRPREDTFDVHFEKARADVQGAYAAINRAFARYIREKYPNVRYLNREEDMGLEGLRQAKRSYRPHHMIEKYKAELAEDGDAH